MKVLVFIKKQAKLMIIITGSVIIGGVTSTAVLASIPDTNGTIHGCYGKAAGNLRVIDSPSKSCTPLENPITWPSANSTASGNAVITSGRITANASDTNNHVVYTLPGFGQIEMNCNNLFTIGINYIYFRNTTQNTIHYLESDGEHDIAPGDTNSVVISTTPLTTTVNGVTKSTTALTTFAGDGNTQTCKAQGQGITQT